MRMSLGPLSGPVVVSLGRLAGGVLVLVGAYLLARSLPGWFWVALAGAALLGAGWRLVSAR